MFIGYTRRTHQISVENPSRHDTHLTHEQTPVLPGINAQTPDTMPRAEDDAETFAQSPEFHDRPGSGRHTADKETYF